MFEATRKDLDTRCDGSLQLFNVVCSSRDRASILRMKGNAFIEMYAVYEYAVRTAVKLGLTEVQTKNIAISGLPPSLQGLILDGKIHSVSEARQKKQWEARTALLSQLQSGMTADIEVDVFPDDGTHFRRTQLETIWVVFDIAIRLVPDGRIFPLMNELVERRNAIAHGRERAEDIGKHYSVDDVRRKIGQTKRLCRHILTAVENRVARI